jgi:hypothetical protein
MPYSRYPDEETAYEFASRAYIFWRAAEKCIHRPSDLDAQAKERRARAEQALDEIQRFYFQS